MDIKYQVFVSSTYEDLKEERDLVIKAILEMGHIPVGMEMFSAADAKQWQEISRRIDATDYYVVIIGHRYGSETDDGISFTEKEYNYAISKGVPVLGFVIHEKAPWPHDKIDSDSTKVQKLTRFKNSVKQKLVKFWHDKMELYGQVPIALHNQIENTARPGWIRTDTTLSRGRGSYRLRDLLERSDVSIGLSEAIIHQDDQEWEAWARGLLSSIPTESGQKSAYFLEHSGSRAQTMIADTLKHGWNVKLLIKNFETEKNRFQRNRIKASMAFFNTAMPEQIQTGRLQIVRTDVAPGLKARYFEDTLLTLSWYLKTAPSPQDSDLWGHENLHVSFVPSSRDWPTALKFWKEKLFVRFTDIARSVS